jgi:hypothetical protein
MSYTVTHNRIPSTDPRLKRHVKHDSRSLLYPFDTSKLKIVSVDHVRHLPILDQGNVGSCTGNAGVCGLGTTPNFEALPSPLPFTLDENGALALYSAAESIDGDGPYPPNDNGSSGLSIAQALLAAGVISGYQHTFTLNDALKALTARPVLFGTNWYDAMFTPDSDGRVHLNGKLAGGHEIEAYQIDAPNKRVWFANSWGSSWGVEGCFYLTFKDFGKLLSQQGDIIVLLPLTEPAPTPIVAAKRASRKPKTK